MAYKRRQPDTVKVTRMYIVTRSFEQRIQNLQGLVTVQMAAQHT